MSANNCITNPIHIFQLFSSIYFNVTISIELQMKPWLNQYGFIDKIYRWRRLIQLCQTVVANIMRGILRSQQLGPIVFENIMPANIMTLLRAIWPIMYCIAVICCTQVRNAYPKLTFRCVYYVRVTPCDIAISSGTLQRSTMQNIFQPRIYNNHIQLLTVVLFWPFFGPLNRRISFSENIT